MKNLNTSHPDDLKNPRRIAARIFGESNHVPETPAYFPKTPDTTRTVTPDGSSVQFTA